VKTCVVFQAEGHHIGTALGNVGLSLTVRGVDDTGNRYKPEHDCGAEEGGHP
jgi:hypothetical protein